VDDGQRSKFPITAFHVQLPFDLALSYVFLDNFTEPD